MFVGLASTLKVISAASTQVHSPQLYFSQFLVPRPDLSTSLISGSSALTCPSGQMVYKQATGSSSPEVAFGLW